MSQEHDFRDPELPTEKRIDALLGNYFGVNGRIVTFLEGITSGVKTGSQVLYSPGTTLDWPNVNSADWSTGEASRAKARRESLKRDLQRIFVPVVIFFGMDGLTD